MSDFEGSNDQDFKSCEGQIVDFHGVAKGGIPILDGLVSKPRSIPPGVSSPDHLGNPFNRNDLRANSLAMTRGKDEADFRGYFVIQSRCKAYLTSRFPGCSRKLPKHYIRIHSYTLDRMASVCMSDGADMVLLGNAR